MRFVLLAALALASSAHPATSQVIVPDDYPTVQQAIDSGAPLIDVKDGTYYEDIVLYSPVELRAYVPGMHQGPPHNPHLVGSVTVNAYSSGIRRLVGFHVSGNILGGGTGIMDVMQCRIEGDIAVDTGVATLYAFVTGNTILGSVNLLVAAAAFTNNTVIGGTVTVSIDNWARVQANQIIDSPGTAIHVYPNPSAADIDRNTVDGAVVGIAVNGSWGGRVSENTVRNTTSHGYLSQDANNRDRYIGNVATDCGGDAFRVESDIPGWIFSGNSAFASGGSGFSVGGEVEQFTENRSIGSGGIGVNLMGGRRVATNTVGRSGGDGIAIAGSVDTLERNTVYLNAGSGMRVQSTSPDSTVLRGNISHGNLGYGLNWSGPAPRMGCNDWFGNVAGETFGVSPGATDLAVNPQFCNLAMDDVTLSSSSQLVGTSCGQIGAEPIGCGSTTGVTAGGAEDSELRVYPQPAHNRVSLSGSALIPGGVMRIFDARGALCSQIEFAKGTRSVLWDLVGMRGTPVPTGIYFALLESGGQLVRERIVVMR